MSLALLQIDFAFPGPWADQLAGACRELADDIAREPGLRWKLWTEDPAEGRAGGIYLFDSRALATRYLDKHRQRLQAFGVSVGEIRAQVFDVNEGLGQLTRAPLGGGRDAFTTLAQVPIADASRFLDVFSSQGLAKRRQHGSLGAESFTALDNAEGELTTHVLIDWRDRAAFDASRADPEVPPTMKSGGALRPPTFVPLVRTGRFAA